ncbi:MAG: hypothetical protein ABI356_02820 [Steroidobacteraceae bacterium]
MSTNSHARTYITGFRGVIEQGYLVRVWDVARDVTELADLNERLRQNQDRLKLYARELAKQPTSCAKFRQSRSGSSPI